MSLAYVLEAANTSQSLTVVLVAHRSVGFGLALLVQMSRWRLKHAVYSGIISFSDEKVLDLVPPRMLTCCVEGEGNERVLANFMTTQTILTLKTLHKVTSMIPANTTIHPIFQYR